MQQDKLNASEKFGAMVAKSSLQGEAAHAHGIYKLTCVGVVNAGDIPRLLKLQAELASFKTKSFAKRLADLLLFKPTLADIKARIAAIPTEVKWQDTVKNVVTDVGKNLLLDTGLAGSAYTVTGPYMGLISSVGYTSVPVAADTMASHATWVEAGNSTNYPLFTARIAPSWSAASAGSKATSAAVSFTIGATGGTLKGCFLVFGSGAVTTLADTNGTLLSAGLFTGGDKVVSPSDVVNVTYSLGL